MNVLSVLLWVPALYVKALLVAVGFFVVPFTGHKHKIWGNNEDPIPRNWYQPPKKENWWAALTASATWVVLLFPPNFVLPIGDLDIAIAGFCGLVTLVFSHGPSRRDYLWRAFRNPANNIRYMLEEPDKSEQIVKGAINPDPIVRDGHRKSAWRWVRAGWYSEFWIVWKAGDDFGEFRIGWKFSDVPGFAPTIQLRVGT